MNTAAELIGLSGVVALEISKDIALDELITLIEFLGLLKHNLEVIKQRKIICKVENKKEDAKKEKNLFKKYV